MEDRATPLVAGLRLAGDPEQARVPDAVAPEASAGRLILLAEDDEDIVELVSVRLERCGYRVVRADNGADAVRLARELHPALAVFDITMPVVSGLEATRSLRADEDPGTAAMPIILLTARAAPGDVAAGLEAGATEYVTKPFSPQDLSRRIDRVLGHG
jgi:two-component system phosphate regulon response regulator PhoB